MLTWVKELPTSEGWWWRKLTNGDISGVVRIRKNSAGVLTYCDCPISEFANNGWWAGPVNEPMEPPPPF